MTPKTRADIEAAADVEAHGAVERVANGLRRAILAGTMPPGSRIRQETVAETFGTSRQPVRLALKRLESEGLVVLVANSGAWVARVDVDACIEIHKIRERLEALAIEEAVPRFDRESVVRLGEIQTRLETTGDAELSLRLDRDFHLLAYAAAGLPRLGREIERLWDATHHYRRAFALAVGPEEARLADYEHRLLIEAIETRDALGAGRLVQSHIRRTRLAFERRRDLIAPRDRG
jgi:DNA-binding GntR family transcriptional regulator